MNPNPKRVPTDAWWQAEQAIALVRLHEILPTEISGISASTIYRWTTVGVAGICLRKFRCGKLWFTTVEEFTRWQAATTVASEVNEEGAA